MINDFLEFMFCMCVICLVVFGTIIGIACFIDYIDCNNIGELYKKETKFFVTSGCYVNDNGEWIKCSLYKKSKLVTDKGATINVRNIGESND